MDISKFSTGVVELWNFVRTRFMACVCLFGIPYFIAPLTVSALARKIPFPTLTAETQKALTTYGLDKLVPAVAFFTILFLAHLANEFVHTGAYILPGHFEFLPPAILSIVLGRHSDSQSPYYRPHMADLVGRLLARFPEATDNFELWGAMAEFVGTMNAVTSELRKNVDYSKRILNRHAGLFGEAKFFLFWAFMTATIELAVYHASVRKVGVRLLIVVGLSAATMMVAAYLTIEDWANVVDITVEAALTRTVCEEKAGRSNIVVEDIVPPTFWRFVWFDAFPIKRVRFFLGWHSLKVTCCQIFPCQDETPTPSAASTGPEEERAGGIGAGN